MYTLFLSVVLITFPTDIRQLIKPLFVQHLLMYKLYSLGQYSLASCQLTWPTVLHQFRVRQ